METNTTRRSGFSVIAAIFLYVCGYLCVTKSVNDTSFIGQIAPFIGYGCILLAAASSFVYLYTTFKGFKKK